MIQVPKDEARVIRKRFPNIHLTRTTNKYYAEEHPELLRFLGRGLKRKDVKSGC